MTGGGGAGFRRPRRSWGGMPAPLSMHGSAVLAEAVASRRVGRLLTPVWLCGLDDGVGATRAGLKAPPLAVHSMCVCPRTASARGNRTVSAKAWRRRGSPAGRISANGLETGVQGWGVAGRQQGTRVKASVGIGESALPGDPALR